MKTVVRPCYKNQGWNSTKDKNVHIKWGKVEPWLTPPKDSVFQKGGEASRETEKENYWIDVAFLALKRRCVLRREEWCCWVKWGKYCDSILTSFQSLWLAKALSQWSGEGSHLSPKMKGQGEAKMMTLSRSCLIRGDKRMKCLVRKWGQEKERFSWTRLIIFWGWWNFFIFAVDFCKTTLVVTALETGF